ncbi:MAG: DUF2334 domain-containing protein [Patescibacteria group bacterium]
MARINSQEVYKNLQVGGIFLVFGLIVSGLLYATYSSPQSDEVVSNDACVPIESNISEKTVVLRVDDIQAYTWRETSMKMIRDAATRNIPLTVGVIPTGIMEDVALINFLKSNDCSVELALHGLTHNSPAGDDVPEFGSYTKEEALTKISEGQNIVASFSSNPISTWIPPLNIHSTGTIAALAELGFTHISAEGQGQFDYDATTFIYGANTLVSPESVVQTCRKTFETSNYCIVMLHPQEFANGLNHDEAKYNQYYLGLLDAFAKEGVTFSRLKDLPL